MNFLLDFKSWISANWMILVLIVVVIALLVPTYLRSKKEMNARQELNRTIKKGVKIITTAGVYGVVDSIEHTTDGDVVTIITGDKKNPTTMTIHINAIAGIDNKTTVVEDATETATPVEEEKEVEETIEEPATVEEPKKTAPKAKKTTKK